MAELPREIWLLIADNLGRNDLTSLHSTSACLCVLLEPKMLGHRFLHIVARQRDNAAVNFVKSHPRIDLSICDTEGRTALECAVIQGSHSVFRLLLAHFQSKRLLETSGARRDTPLISAARHNQDHMAAALIAAGANVNARNASDQTALSWAIQNGNCPLAERLLGAKADVTFTYGGLTALWLAAKGRQLAISELLISYGANVNARDAYFETMLCWAVKRNNGTYIKMLLNGGADPSRTDKLGRDPLTWAALTDNVEIAKAPLPRCLSESKRPVRGAHPSHGRL